MPIHLLTPPLSERIRVHADRVVALWANALERDSTIGTPGVVIAPAGMMTVDDEDRALACAERIRMIARRTGTAVVFGLDVGPPASHAGRMFACLGGSPAIWPAVSQARFPVDAARRVLQLGAMRLLPLFAAEALDPTAPRRIAKMGGIDLIAVLSHGGATKRWVDALSRLEQLAPLVVSTHAGGIGRGYVSPPLQTRFCHLTVAEPVPQAA
jgi:hypothetical protein